MIDTVRDFILYLKLCNRTILGTTSFDKNYGHSTPNYETAEMKKSLINISRIKIVLCESSKINQRSFKQFAAPDECDYLITDSHITQEQKAELDGLRVNLLIA
ncbi:DeoR/GlpR transcriptional regulator [Enterococcus gallinarum]|uniref:DeoR/GlpR transcriptional regulator n=1 Tax=Enterococcus gallinarum TaxID=1353 RepID=UPI00391B0C59